MSIQASTTGPVLTLSLNNPKRANALTSQMCNQLLEALDAAEKDPSVRVVVLTGEGKYFSAGMDLARASDGSNAPFDAAMAVFRRIKDFPKPTIGRVNGPALGGGVGLLFSTDIRIAVDHAFIQLAEVKRGLIPAIISLVIVP
ncbi:hypothetical protein HDU98_008919 [Podochytrium sp. JEL0797]|nr:hypothetical protein HDU98_008919 [Podochytrium sp. JEL0797]